MSEEKEKQTSAQAKPASSKGCLHRLKKTALWLLALLLALVILIPVLVYLPPIQRYAVEKASKWLSEETGMDVSVGEFRLRFPLDLSMGDVLALQDGDTAVFAENLDVSVQLLPLLKSKVAVDKVELENAVLHTNDLIASMRLDGRVGSLSVKADSIDLANEYGNINQLRLRDTDLTIALADSVPPDTTESEPTKWRFNLADVQTEKVNITVQLPPAADSTFVKARLGDGHIKGTIDLGTSLFSFPEIRLEDSSVGFRSGTDTDITANFSQLTTSASLNLENGDYKLSALKMEDPDILLALGGEQTISVQSEGLRLNGDINTGTNQFSFSDIALDKAKIRLDQQPDMSLKVDASRISLDGNLDMNTSDYHLTGIELEKPSVTLTDGNAMNLDIQMQRAQLDGHLNLETSDFRFDDISLSQPEIAMSDVSGMDLNVKMDNAKLDGRLNLDTSHYQFKDVALGCSTISMRQGKDMDLNVSLDKAHLNSDMDMDNAVYDFSDIILQQPSVKLRQGSDLTMDVESAKMSLDASLALNTSEYAFNDVRMAGTKASLSTGDGMSVDTHIGKGVLSGKLDLDNERYTFSQIGLANADMSYNVDNSKPTQGFDPSHIAMRGMNADFSSVEYGGDGSLKLDIAHLSGKERSGLTLNDANGTFAMTDKGMNLDKFHVQTAHSTINMDLAMDNDAFDTPARGKKPGQFNIKMDGTIGRGDLAMALDGIRPDIARDLPQKSLRAKVDAHGNMENLQVDNFEARMDGVMDVKGNLSAKGLSGNSPSLASQFTAKIPDTQFINHILPSDYQLPQSVDLTADTRYGSDGIYAKAHGTLGGSKVDIDGKVGLQSEDYDFAADVSNFRLQDYLPHGDRIELSGYVKAKGHGFDPFAPTTTTNATLDLDRLTYEDLELRHINGTVALFRGDLDANLSLRDPKIETTFTASGKMQRQGIKADIDIDLRHADLHALGMYDGELEMSTKGKFSLDTDLSRNYHATAQVDTLHLLLDGEELATNHADLFARTNEDTTLIALHSEDISVDMQSPENLFDLIDKYSQTASIATRFAQRRQLNINLLKRHFPEASLKVSVGEVNPLLRLMQLQGITFKSLTAELSTDSVSGIQGDMLLKGFQMDSIKADETTLAIRQDSTAIKFDAKTILPDHPDFKGFSALASGYVTTDQIEAEVKHFDKAGDMGVDLGFNVHFADSGITGHLLPEHPTLAYIPFRLNDGNYIRLDTLNNLFADIRLTSEADSCQLTVNATNEGSSQVMSAIIEKLDLSKITPLAPGLIPQMDGLMNVNVNYFSDLGRFTVSGNGGFSDFVFDGTKVGNIGADFTYTPEGDSLHIIRADISSGDSIAIAVDGTYNSTGEGNVDADVRLNDFPLSMTAPFIPDQLFVLGGSLGGSLHVSGGGNQYTIDGQLTPSQVTANSEIYSLNLRFEDKPIAFDGSRITFDDHKIFGSGENPLTLSGWCDIADLSLPELNLSLYGKNFSLMNAPRTRKSLVFGKMDGDIFARVHGTPNDISIRGMVKLLPTTDMTYIMANTPLSVDYRLSDIVTFVDFNRPPEQEEAHERPVYTNTDMLVNLIADDGAKFHCEFSADRQSYVDVVGEGSFNLTYTPAGALSLIGRYTIDQGKMKYTLPAIPLKTFDINKGSYIEFTGEPGNPMLNFAANEQTTATVSEEGMGSRSVKFKTGLEVKGTLDQMELLFTIDAPEDINVKNELASMTPEERNKLAVAMLCTGMYLAGGNSSGFDTSNALNSFLETEINNIANKALSTTVNVDMGVEQTTRDDGSTRTNYSFKFSRRFFNDRLNVIIGGKVSSDDSEYENESGAYIDDVSLEWRLNDSGTQYVRLFHERNFENLLEGELISNGVSYVFRKKYGKLSEIWKPIRLKKPATLK